MFVQNGEARSDVTPIDFPVGKVGVTDGNNFRVDGTRTGSGVAFHAARKGF